MSPIPPELPAGPWEGWYRLPRPYDRAPHRMALVLRVEGTKISGEGQDDVGAFSLDGTNCLGHCRLRKIYRGAHVVLYEGHWNGASLDGNWTIPGVWSGTFSLWPVPA